jgi:hypothetical protein
MTSIFIPDKQLDRFGPYGSAIGSLIGVILYFVFLGYLYFGAIVQLFLFPLVFLAGPIFALYFNTCIHMNSYFFGFSKSALYGGIGAFIGQIIGSFIAYPVGMFIMYWPFLIYAPFPILFSYLFARITCNDAKKRLSENSSFLD